ncbi:Outer membrane protein assembly factor BamD [BD1-7 clade bacterium]|uniref:Outer membrane protein assembly factor BamD n=1 Tax=BD1-7 clade bacterium TaxID=2029982 RepID=A0A5S9QYH6_9GAMM|nr:Outer membrane protein assembly factor BamD [BD1-7 clade bacterium]
MRSFLLVIFSCLFLAACAGQSKNQFDNLSEDQLYQKARSYMVDRKFNKAVEAYQALETRFPFGKYAEQSQLEIITAYYQSQEYEAAIASADRFTRLHPQHPEADYAYYYKGLANFDANRTLFDRFFNMDMAKRDPGTARDSFNDFAELLSKYPDSRFAADARGRMIFLRNILARHEVHVADFYMRRAAYMAAVNRGSYVVEHFQETPAVGDALAIMVQGYNAMGLPDLAEDSLEVLRVNFPKHHSLKDGKFNPEYTLETSELQSAEDGTSGYSRPKNKL